MALALRFISGKYQGGEFPLEEGQEILVGRSSDLNMVLVEEMVSRKHARMLLHPGARLEIEDLNSTNGTFVNGERVSKTTVGLGDRILIGSNILRVVSSSADDLPAPTTARSASSRKAVRRPAGISSAESRMTGELHEIPLPDLLQLFGTSKKDGVLLVDSDPLIARIVLKSGLIHFAEIRTPDGDVLPVGPAKAMYRILTWENGIFELDPPEEEEFEKPLDMSAQEVLMEGFRQKDELARLQPRLPAPTKRMELSTPLEAQLSLLGKQELEVLQMAINSGNLEGVMDNRLLSDADTAKALVHLLESGYLRIVD